MSESIWIELRGLRVDARIGVSDAELEVERELSIDVDLVPERSGATESDRIEETIDYGRVAEIAERAASTRPHRTLERLAAEIAEAVLDLGSVAEVGVRVAKPNPPLPQRVENVAVRVARVAGPE